MIDYYKPLDIMKQNTKTNQDKILEISKELGITHIGSNLSALPILEEIYSIKKPEDKVILDNGHAHLAHLVVQGKDSSLIEQYGIHCDRKAGCDASGGSLGHGLGIAIGYALANPEITVYVITSDGALHEGSNWEAIRLISKLKLNIEVYVNANGYTAVAQADNETFEYLLNYYLPNVHFIHTSNTEEFDGVEGHYKKI